MSSVFSPLAHGYGSWTGELDFPELRELEATKPVVSELYHLDQ